MFDYYHEDYTTEIAFPNGVIAKLNDEQLGELLTEADWIEGVNSDGEFLVEFNTAVDDSEICPVDIDDYVHDLVTGRYRKSLVPKLWNAYKKLHLSTN